MVNLILDSGHSLSFHLPATGQLPLKHVNHIGVCHLLHAPSRILMNSWLIDYFLVRKGKPIS